MKWNEHKFRYTNKSQQQTNFFSPKLIKKLCEIIGTEMFAFLQPCDLNEGQGHLN